MATRVALIPDLRTQHMQRTRPLIGGWVRIVVTKGGSGKVFFFFFFSEGKKKFFEVKNKK